MIVSFTVYGTPLPKGSTRAFMPKGARFPVITSATKGLKQWEARVAAVAQDSATGELMTGPISLQVTFHLTRPKSLSKKPVHHTKRPDLDKLIRGATDALTGVIWKDDSQLTNILAEKMYVPEASDAPRAHFIITQRDK